MYTYTHATYYMLGWDIQYMYNSIIFLLYLLLEFQNPVTLLAGHILYMMYCNLCKMFKSQSMIFSQPIKRVYLHPKNILLVNFLRK